MNKLTQKKRDLILGSHINFKAKGILVLDDIHGKPFETFKNILVKRNSPISNEELVFFKDLTWFGSGEEGFLITSEYFYYYQWGFKVIKISHIRELKIGGLLNENIVFTLENGQTISIWLSKFFDEVKAVIEVLNTVDTIEEIETKPASIQMQCLGCKAIIRSNQNFCEYCRSPLL